MLTEETSVGNERALQKLKAQLNLWRAASLVSGPSMAPTWPARVAF